MEQLHRGRGQFLPYEQHRGGKGGPPRKGAPAAFVDRVLKPSNGGKAGINGSDFSAMPKRHGQPKEQAKENGYDLPAICRLPALLILPPCELRCTLRTVAALFDAWSDGHESGMAPSVVNVPVSIIHGVDDPFVTSDLLTNAILPRFDRARITSISNSSHWPHLDQPAETAEAIDGFLAEIGWSQER